MADYNEMLRRIEPKKTFCYNTPFPEMRGDNVYVDYERSSLKYMGDERVSSATDPDAFKIGSACRTKCDTIGPYLIPDCSYRGGDWQPNPNKPNDEKLIGKSDEMKKTFDEHGELYETHIGPSGM